MVEDKKVLLVKVDTLKNIADALTKSVSTKKFSWCRQTFGVGSMTKLSCGPLWKENNKWENVGLCYILSMTSPSSEARGLEDGRLGSFSLHQAQRGGHRGGRSPPVVGFEGGGSPPLRGPG